MMLAREKRERYFRRILPAVIAAAPLVVMSAASAQTPDWPQRPVKIVVPYAPGGNTDAIARLTAERLTGALGQQVIVENRAGAGGAIAAEFVAKALADGYTLFVAALSQFGPVPLTQKVAYNPLKDFAPVSNIAANGFVIAVSNSVPAANLKEFIDAAKAKPNAFNYGSGGSGSLTHLAAALFLQRAGVQMVHVPYKGGAPALADTLAGQVQMYAASPSEVIQHGRAGKLRLLGISTAQRNPQLPDVPAIGEILPGFKVSSWNGLFAPAGTPPAILTRLEREMQNILKEPRFLEQLAKMGLEPVTGTSQEFAESLRGEYAMWRGVIKNAGLSVE